MLSLLQKNYGEIKYHDVCCHHYHSMIADGKQPLYLPDLVFGYGTGLMTNSLDEYHNDLNEYIELH